MVVGHCICCETLYYIHSTQVCIYIIYTHIPTPLLFLPKVSLCLSLSVCLPVYQSIHPFIHPSRERERERERFFPRSGGGGGVKLFFMQPLLWTYMLVTKHHYTWATRPNVLRTVLSLWVPGEQSCRDYWEPDLSTCMWSKYPPELKCVSKGVTEKWEVIFADVTCPWHITI